MRGARHVCDVAHLAAGRVVGCQGVTKGGVLVPRSNRRSIDTRECPFRFLPSTEAGALASAPRTRTNWARQERRRGLALVPRAPRARVGAAGAARRGFNVRSGAPAGSTQRNSGRSAGSLPPPKARATHMHRLVVRL